MCSNFDFLEKYFILCSVNLQINNSILTFGVSIIDSYTNTVKLCEFNDNDFFTSLENLLLQIAPSHEDINFFIIGHFPFDIYAQKFKNIVEKIESANGKEFLTNSKDFNPKSNGDYISGIKMLLSDS